MIAGMADFIQIVITTYAALFPICNPLGNAPIYRLPGALKSAP